MTDVGIATEPAETGGRGAFRMFLRNKAAVLGLVGLVNLPIVKFSVDWWNTLHQPASFLTPGSSGLDPVYLPPFLTMLAAYGVLFAALWLTAIRTEIRRRRVVTLRARRALEA